MTSRTPFFKEFGPLLFGRRSGSQVNKIEQLDSMEDLCAIFGELMPERMIYSAKPEVKRRVRSLPAEVTFWAFVSQALSPRSSCREVVRKIEAWQRWQDLRSQGITPSAYCQARRKLDLDTLLMIRRHLSLQLERNVLEEEKWLKKRTVKIVDGTTFSMPDTVENQAVWPQSSTQKPGCRACGKRFIPALPGLLPGRHSTEPFREKIARDHHEGICVSSLARLAGVSEASVERFYAASTQRKAAERESLQCPIVLGIDEHTLHKKQRFATTFCDLKNRRVFDIVPGKSAKDLEAFLSKLQGREKVKAICIDLSNSYRSIIKKWFPGARIVADRFHVLRIIQHHFIALCREIMGEAKNQHKACSLLRTNPENLKARGSLRLQELFLEFPALKPIYEEMNRLRALINIKSRRRKECWPLAKALTGFIERLEVSCFQPLMTLAATLRSWAEPIACMWRFTRNNGITEGFHRKMKLIQRRAYGFKNFQNYRLRVIAQCG